MDSREWDERYAASDLVWGAEPNRWLVAEAAALPPGRALDLAAGEGRNAIWLAARGWRVTAVDFAGTALDRGRQLAAGHPGEVAGRLEWVRSDVLDHQPPEGGYDLVLLAYLHLVADQRRLVLGRAAAALAPAGTLLVIGHDTTNLDRGVGGPQDRAVLFGPEDVVTDLAGSGLVVERAERVPRPVPGPDGAPGREAIDALVRMTRPASG